MNLEQLNKTQIILLTLLVSFVTSIATAIATAALIQKAPADITRVISHTIEQPVQTVVPGQTEVVTKTVVVQQSDLIGQAIQKIQPSIVQIFEKGKPLTAFLALGAVIDAKGMILTDASVLQERHQYVIVLQDGKELTATTGIASGGTITLTPDASQGNEIPSFTPVSPAQVSELSLGQTVVALGQSSSYVIAPGVITQIISPTSDKEARAFVHTTVDLSNMVAGSPLVTTEGALVGILYQGGQDGLFRSLFLQAGAGSQTS